MLIISILWLIRCLRLRRRRRRRRLLLLLIIIILHNNTNNTTNRNTNNNNDKQIIAHLPERGPPLRRRRLRRTIFGLYIYIYIYIYISMKDCIYSADYTRTIFELYSDYMLFGYKWLYIRTIFGGLYSRDYKLTVSHQWMTFKRCRTIYTMFVYWVIWLNNSL